MLSERSPRGIDGDPDGTGLEESVVEAKGAGGGPAFVCDLGLLAAHCSVYGEFRLRVEAGGESSEHNNGENYLFAIHD
jgi:hypothetical protein